MPTPAPLPAAFVKQLMDAHNKYRAQAGVPPLVWSDDLANAAQAWVTILADESKFEHDRNLRDQGENIWMGTSDGYTATQMVDAWGSEIRNFKSGTFPNVAITGGWESVGHYTQMVWRNTTSVGCAGTDGPDRFYRLVCRYGPVGNVMGQPVY